MSGVFSIVKMFINQQSRTGCLPITLCVLIRASDLDALKARGVRQLLGVPLGRAYDKQQANTSNG